MPKKILLVTEPSKGLTVITNIVEPTLFLSKMAVWVSYFPPDTSEEPAEIWSTNFSNTRFWKAKIEPIKKFCTKIRGNWLHLCGRRRHLLCKQNWRMASSSCAYDIKHHKRIYWRQYWLNKHDVMQEKFLLDRIRVDCSNTAPHTRYSVQIFCFKFAKWSRKMEFRHYIRR